MNDSEVSAAAERRQTASRRAFRGDRDFLDEEKIAGLLRSTRNPDKGRVLEIVDKALALHRLDPVETAVLLNVTDREVWDAVFEAARSIRDRVYGPRIVTFAPLYCSNLCVNSCRYCAFRKENSEQCRRQLSPDEVAEEVRALVAAGHKRLIMVYGEHPEAGVEYVRATIEAAYRTKEGKGEIRRVNVNASPLTVEDYRRVAETGIGTYQIFQETYHRPTYRRVHPRGPKADYLWRLLGLHRAQEAGIDDVGIGVLFGLYDWKFEVMGLLCHAIDLEEKFGGVGPHTISFPRLEPAQNAPLAIRSPHRVSDLEFLRLIAVLRLSVPYTGMIVTARETATIRRAAIELGCTQTDASSRIGVGAYRDSDGCQDEGRQQFMLGDTRDLDEVVRELAGMGYLTSFCTSGYRCGRTGQSFMRLAKSGEVHRYCIPNAILTMNEFLLDYASDTTRAAGEELMADRLAQLPEATRALVTAKLRRAREGSRDERL